MCDFCENESHQSDEHVCGKCGVKGKHSENDHHEIKTIYDLVRVVNKDNVQMLATDLAQFLNQIAHLKAHNNMHLINDPSRFGWIDDGRNDVVVHDGKGKLHLEQEMSVTPP